MVGFVKCSKAQYCLRRFKRPRKIMALAGITSEGTRFLEFFKPNQMMNSDLYCRLLKKEASKIVKQRNLIILQDRSKIHSSRKTAAFLKTEKMKSIMLPGKSYNLNPIENCFGLLKRKLEKEPTRSLEEASWALSAVLWIQNHKSIDLYYTNPVKSSQQIQLALEETCCTSKADSFRVNHWPGQTC